MRAVLRWSRKGGVARRYAPWVLLWAILVGLPLAVFGGEEPLRLVGAGMVVLGALGWSLLGWIRPRAERLQWTPSEDQIDEHRCLICHRPFEPERGYAALYLTIEDPVDEHSVEILEHVAVAATSHLPCLPAFWDRLSSLNPEREACYLPSREELCATLERVQS